MELERLISLVSRWDEGTRPRRYWMGAAPNRGVTIGKTAPFSREQFLYGPFCGPQSWSGMWAVQYRIYHIRSDARFCSICDPGAQTTSGDVKEPFGYKILKLKRKAWAIAKWEGEKKHSNIYFFFFYSLGYRNSTAFGWNFKTVTLGNGIYKLHLIFLKKPRWYTRGIRRVVVQHLNFGACQI